MVNKELGGEVNKPFQLLVDSDAFVGRFFPKDGHHQKALSLFHKQEKMGIALTTTSMVIAESATVLSHRTGQDVATKFLEIIERSKLAVIHIDTKLQQEAYRVFKAQSKRGTSVTDCANVVVMQRFQIPKIFSFDKAYEKQFGLQMLR